MMKRYAILFIFAPLSVSAHSAIPNEHNNDNSESASNLAADQMAELDSLADRIAKSTSQCIYDKSGARGYLKFARDNKTFQDIMDTMCSPEAYLLAGSAQMTADDFARSDSGKILADCEHTSIEDFHSPAVSKFFNTVSPIYGILDNKGHPIDLCGQFRKKP